MDGLKHQWRFNWMFAFPSPPSDPAKFVEAGCSSRGTFVDFPVVAGHSVNGGDSGTVPMPIAVTLNTAMWDSLRRWPSSLLLLLGTLLTGHTSLSGNHGALGASAASLICHLWHLFHDCGLAA